MKDIPIIFNTYQKLKLAWNKSKVAQIIIMNQVLKYNKRKFYKYAGAFQASKIRDTAYLTWLYHVIEKGLAMPQMKIGFGQEKIRELCEKLETYAGEYGKDNVTYASGISTLYQYKMTHQDIGFSLPIDIENAIDRLIQKADSIKMNEGGIQENPFTRMVMQSTRYLQIADIL